MSKKVTAKRPNSANNVSHAKNVTKRTVTIKKLDRKTKFYFKVRAYTKVGTKKVYGAWSKTKSVKVK